MVDCVSREGACLDILVVNKPLAEHPNNFLVLATSWAILCIYFNPVVLDPVCAPLRQQTGFRSCLWSTDRIEPTALVQKLQVAINYNPSICFIVAKISQT